MAGIAAILGVLSTIIGIVLIIILVVLPVASQISDINDQISWGTDVGKIAQGDANASQHLANSLSDYAYSLPVSTIVEVILEP